VLFFTICSNNYLAQAITLGYSLVQFNPECVFKIGLVDQKNSGIEYSNIPFEIIEVENIGISAFENFFKKYNITELNTAVKPFYFQFLFENFSDINTIVYLDPDILVFDTFKVLEEELKYYDIVITPHFTTPIIDNLKQCEEDFLNSGLYNLGFIAIKKTDNSCKMIEWWSERLKDKAFIALDKGMFTDQIWINFVPLFFEKVKILNHPGYNMAYWNMHERKLSVSSKKNFVNEDYPLIFFHFSGYSPLNPDILSKYQNRFIFKERADIKEIFHEYTHELIKNGFYHFINFPCIYNGIKEEYEKDILLEKINAIPLIKRIIRKIIIKLISKFNIILDYSTLNLK